MPNSDSANALRHTFTSSRFRTQRILWVAEFRFGKCRQAYFFLKGLQLKVSDLFGKSEFANPFFAYLYILHN
ncbi:MAG TPA: hypothetical protein PLJ85_00925 [Candidatus Cloacimonas sp.]|nr:hypothetical protein [Candidatus Cloacimonas sp.]